jgi:hypothetical protein
VTILWICFGPKSFRGNNLNARIKKNVLKTSTQKLIRPFWAKLFGSITLKAKPP